jgi:hypothetical protein
VENPANPASAALAAVRIRRLRRGHLMDYMGKGNNADRFSDRDFLALSVTRKF